MLVVLLLSLAAPPSDLSAVGAVLAHRPERSVAVLQAGGRTRLVSPGETAFGGRLVSVDAHSAVVDFEGTQVTLRLAGGPALAPTPPPGPPSAPAPAATTATAPNEVSLPRAELQARVGREAPRILAETTLIPAMEGNAVAGFTITRMPEGSLLSDLGLRAGDVILRVNGTPVDSLATLIGLWPRLQGESAVQADLLRDGAPLTLTVKLK